MTPWNQAAAYLRLPDPRPIGEIEEDIPSKGDKREGTQFDHCYVGAMSFEGKKVIGRETVDVSADSADWTAHRKAGKSKSARATAPTSPDRRCRNSTTQGSS